MIDGVTDSVQPAAQPPPQSGAPHNKEARPEEESRTLSDAVELSPMAREQIERSESMPIRGELVERIRAEIDAGTYLTDLTDEMLDALVERLHQVLNARA
jgi:anti-sigma28 factor (negative regulator of flagellin synthesis)